MGTHFKPKKSYTKEERERFARQREEKVDAAMEEVKAGVKDIFSSGKFREYLDVMEKFHSYSLNNIILISVQNPYATHVAGAKAWEKKFGRKLLPEERANPIRILAPNTYAAWKTVMDPVTKEPLLDQDGNPIREKHSVMDGYRVVNVYDISQTEGKELPSLGASELYGDVEGYEKLLNAALSFCPAEIVFKEIPGWKEGVKGYYSASSGEIAVKSGMSQTQTLKTLFHEMAHQALHTPKDGKELPSREVKEMQAESAAYVVCSHFGVDTSDYTFGYVAGWQGKDDPDELIEALLPIRGAANDMISGIEKELERQERAAGVRTPEEKADIEEGR